MTIPKAEVIIGFRKSPAMVVDGDAIFAEPSVTVGTLEFGFDPRRPSDKDIKGVISDNTFEEKNYVYRMLKMENMQSYADTAMEAETELFKRAVVSLTKIVSDVMKGAGLKHSAHYWQVPQTWPDNDDKTWTHHGFPSDSYNRSTQDTGVILYQPEIIENIQKSIDIEIAEAKKAKFKGGAKRKTGDLPPLG